ncbi:hypothetical protein EXIGLDRAFT_496705 [Exidia glandulosa HHB12029]|uniref:Uncharacterized protein n=1 Tax=Exidia glandulosa HHB12029 TaxID=1314781 RepID=A0A166ASW8_EXIGL|nr:hypothetical protein EXIGLDRAFT_496705 [Exidia glandulosa HHB12029]
MLVCLNPERPPIEPRGWSLRFELVALMFQVVMCASPCRLYVAFAVYSALSDRDPGLTRRLAHKAPLRAAESGLWQIHRAHLGAAHLELLAELRSRLMGNVRRSFTMLLLVLMRLVYPRARHSVVALFEFEAALKRRRAGCSGCPPLTHGHPLVLQHHTPPSQRRRPARPSAGTDTAQVAWLHRSLGPEDAVAVQHYRRAVAVVQRCSTGP